MRPLVLVPTYNERDNLQPLVDALLAIDGLRVLIVDDNSPDGTGDVAEALAAASGGRVSVMHRAGSSRAWAAPTSTAWRRRCAPTRRTSARWTPTSRTIRPRSRVCSRPRPRRPGHRVALRPRRSAAELAGPSRGAQHVRQLVRARHHAASGARLHQRLPLLARDLLARLPLDRIVSDGYAFQVEMAWEAQAAGGRIVEVPITFVERREGQSKMSGRVIAESVVLPWRLVGAAAPVKK